MKRRLLSLALFVAVLLSMAMIFYNSSQTASVSSARSKNIAERLIELKNELSTPRPADDLQTTPSLGAGNQGGASNDPEQEKPAVTQTEINSLDNLLRKYSHAAEFMLLGLTLVLFAFVHFGKPSRLYIAVSFAFSVLYALTDEWHQTFVDGRSYEISDIMLDSIGAALGAIFAASLYFVLTKYKRSE